MKYLILLVGLLVVSCQTTSDHGHDHDTEDAHSYAGDETPTEDMTVWTDKTELFVEFPALIVGQTSRFAAHFTVLEKHQPVREGSLTVSLVKDNKGIRQTAEAPDSPGIFKPTLQPKEAGLYQLVFDLKTPSITDQIVVKDVRVFASLEEATEVLGDEEEGGGEITFLKEQAWKMEFQTVPVVEKEIYEIIPTSGKWKLAPSNYQTLVATSNGRVSLNENLTEGQQVKNGQLLMTVVSTGLTNNNLSTEIQKAEAELDQAQSEFERKKQLYESKIVSKADFEKAEQRYRVAKANYETLSSGYSSGGKQIIAPMNGYVKSVSVVNGDFVEQGDELVIISSHQNSLLEASVSPEYADQLQSLQNIWYQPKSDVWSDLKKSGSSIISVGKEVDENKPLLSVFAEINDVVEMPEGSFTEVQLAFGEPKISLTIPVEALLEDYGNYSVIVQVSGESFERRQVVIGTNNGTNVEIKNGLKKGEMVVSKGAYQVKMASMSGQIPAHGHTH